MIYIRIASPPIIQTPHFNLQVESLLCCLMCVYLVQALFYLPWDIWPTSSSMNSCDRSTVTKYQNYFTNPNNAHFQQILTVYDDVVCFFWSQKNSAELIWAPATVTRKNNDDLHFFWSDKDLLTFPIMFYLQKCDMFPFIIGMNYLTQLYT